MIQPVTVNLSEQLQPLRRNDYIALSGIAILISSPGQVVFLLQSVNDARCIGASVQHTRIDVFDAQPRLSLPPDNTQHVELLRADAEGAQGMVDPTSDHGGRKQNIQMRFVNFALKFVGFQFIFNPHDNGFLRFTGLTRFVFQHHTASFFAFTADEQVAVAVECDALGLR